MEMPGARHLRGRGYLRRGLLAVVVFAAGTSGGLAQAKDQPAAPAPVEPRIERPTGDYARWTLHLPGAFVADVRSKSPKKADLRLLVWTRGQDAVQAMAESVPGGVLDSFRERDLSDLNVVAGKLAGRIRFGMHYELNFSTNWPNVWFDLEIEAAAEGERVSGRYSGTCAVAAAPHEKDLTVSEIEKQLADARQKAAKAVGGHITAVRHGGDAYAGAEALAPGKGWTRWLGSDGTMHGQNSGRPLVADLRNARLVWRSEQDLLPGKGQVTRYGGFGIYYKKPSGGGSSPIVADGKVYLYYYVPSGEAYLKEEEQKRAAQGYFLKDMWRLRADDVVLCLDAATGRTLWKTTFPGAGRTFLTGKSNLINNTVAVADGVVAAVGGMGRVYALDARTGDVRWQAVIDRVWQGAMNDLAKGAPGGGRSFPHAVTMADGVVAVADEGGGMVGFDLKTGQKRWYVANCLGRFVTPPIWRHGGEAHLMTYSRESVVAAVKAKTGEAVWRVENLGKRKWGNESPYLQGDYMVVSATDEEDIKAGKVPGHQVACYRLSAGGAAKVWDLPADRYHYPVHSAGNGSIVGLDECHVAFANGGRADTSGKRPYLVVVELATGKVVQEVYGGEGATVPVNWGAPTFVAADDLLVAMRDNWHCKTDFYTFRLAGARVTPFGGTFALPHWPTTSYEIPMVYPVVDGRLFIRGALGIYCYDLRQPGPVTP